MILDSWPARILSLVILVVLALLPAQPRWLRATMLACCVIPSVRLAYPHLATGSLPVDVLAGISELVGLLVWAWFVRRRTKTLPP
jgi:hypothetical protein